MPSGTGRRSGHSEMRKTSAPQKPAGFAPLPGSARKTAGLPLKVCVVTSEILGPVKNGGIGTATSALIDHLAGDGHDVTILYTHVQRGEPDCAERNWAHWVDLLARRSIALVHIAHDGDYRDWLLKSWLVKMHLGAHDYDAVYFNEHHGSAYYALAAKRAGLQPFASQVHCVITHGSIEWVMNTNDQHLQRAADLLMMGIERRSVEWADAVIGPSQYLLQEYQAYGWKLPVHTYRQPYAFPIATQRRPRSRTKVDELVFFGRLETRKGLWLFCEALDRMGQDLRGRKITFMGRPSEVAGLQSPLFILSRAEKWPCEVNLLLDYSQEQALAYLAEPGRVAVMPSLADNSPCVVYECMQQQIPFIATSGSGADELVHEDCSAIMCPANAIELAEKLSDVLQNGASTAWPRFEAAENLARWTAWNRLLADPRARRDFLAASSPDRAAKGATPAVASAFLMIDDRSVPLGELFDRFQNHVERFGQLGRFAFLTTRDEPLRSLIEGVLQARASQAGAEFSLLQPATLGRFLQSVRKGNCCLFVTDICDEMSDAFVEVSRSMRASNAAVAVTCAAAVRRSPEDIPTIVELPAGDLPAAGGLGMPITSSAWSVAGTMVADYLKASDFADPVTGQPIPAQDVGQLLFHRLIIAGQPVRLIPEVGTVRTTEARHAAHHRHWYGSSVLHAEALDVKPVVYQDAAAWLAVSAFGLRGATPPERPASMSLLPVGHPLREIAHSGTETADISRYAAAMGRPDQAMQVSVAAEIDVGVEELLAIAVRSVRERVPIDLLALLSLRVKPDTAPAALRILRASTANLALSRSPQGLFVQFGDVDLRAGTATFFDVALSGHAAYTLVYKAGGSEHCDIGASIIDQATGATLGSVTERVRANHEQEIEIPLHGIHGMFCIIVEITTAARSQPALTISRMRIA